MGIGDLPLFAALKQKMQWHQTRQGLLAENVANAETPGFRGQDLRAFDFEEQLRQQSSVSVATMATNSKHFVIEASSTNGFEGQRLNNFELTPEGNGITLEDEMMKVSSNQMDYQAATTIYSRSVRLLRTAIGR